MNKSLAITLCLLLLLSTMTFAYDGYKLSFPVEVQQNGVRITGTEQFTYKFYDNLTGGNLLLAKTANETIISGVANVVLDGLSGIDWSQTVYLEIEVGGEILTPRMELTPSPDSLNNPWNFNGTTAWPKNASTQFLYGGSELCTVGNGLCGASGSSGGWTNTSTTTSTGLDVNITARSSTAVPLTVQGAASQSANLQEWQDSSGDALAYVKPDGSLELTNDLQFTGSNEVTYIGDDQPLGLFRTVSVATPGYGATGNYSVAVGWGAKDNGYDQGAALGSAANVFGDYGVAIGNTAWAYADGVSIGRTARGTSSRAVSIGRTASAGFQGTAIGGIGAIASGGNSVALGAFTDATGASSFAMGDSAQATDSYAIAIGSGANASAQYAVAIGKGAKSDVNNKMVLGTSAEPLNLYSYGNANFTSWVKPGECDGTEVEGAMCYNSTAHNMYFYDGTVLVAMS